MNRTYNLIRLTKLRAVLTVQRSLEDLNLLQYFKSCSIFVKFETKKRDVTLDFACLNANLTAMIVLIDLFDDA